VVELSRALDVRLSKWCCSVSRVWCTLLYGTLKLHEYIIEIILYMLLLYIYIYKYVWKLNQAVLEFATFTRDSTRTVYFTPDKDIYYLYTCIVIVCEHGLRIVICCALSNKEWFYICFFYIYIYINTFEN
jgi:hypothetical protein